MGGVARDVALLDLLQEQRQVTSLLRQIANGGVTPASVVQSIRTTDEMLQVLLAALKRGQIDRWFSRQTMAVPAGTTQTMTMPLPQQGFVGLVVGEHLMQVSPSLSTVLVTHIDDRSASPLIDKAPANGPIGLLGAFIRPVQSEIVHIVQGDANEDVVFTMQLQGVLMAQTYWSNTFQPMLQSWYTALTKTYGR